MPFIVAELGRDADPFMLHLNAAPAGRSSLIGAADDHARSMLPILRTLRAEGTITIPVVTRSLNERKILTARGSRWHVSSVADLPGRAQKLEAIR